MGLLNSATEGEYFLNGVEVAGLGQVEKARVRNQEIGFIFQAFNLIGDMNVFENVELPLTYRDDLSRKQRRELVLAALYPGVTATEVATGIGWPLRTRSRLGEVSPPTDRELHLLREVLDPKRLYLKQ